MANKQTIIIDAKVQTTLEGMNKVVTDLKKGLGEGVTKVDLTKGVGNSLSKQIERFRTEYDKFTRLTADGKLDFGDSKEAIQSGEQMIKVFRELQRVVGNFEELTVFDAKKLFPQAFDTRVSELQDKLTNFQTALSRLQMKEIDLSAARDSLGTLETNVQLLQDSLAKELEMRVDTKQTDDALEKTKQKIAALRDELKETLKNKIGTAEKTVTGGTDRIEEIRNNRRQRGATEKPTLVSLGKNATEEQKQNQRAAIALWEKEQEEITILQKAIENAQKAKKKYTETYAQADTMKMEDLAKAAEVDTDKIDQVTRALNDQKDASENARKANEALVDSQNRETAIKKNLDKANEAVQKQRTEVNRLQQEYNLLEQKLNAEGFQKAFDELNIDFSPEMLKNAESVEKLQNELNNLSKQDLKKLISSLQQMGLTSKQAEDFVESLRKDLSLIDKSAKDIKKAEQEMENLKNQILQFFSITNAIQLFKRTVQSALNTVKELDATMTEAAVVTDFSIGDMWDQLPKYSKEAQKLGVSINGMYQATTLYYQQGLKNNEAMALGVETMKMAKIAAMDSTEATTAMTAALRGFNMELNETSATRVNDVYSQLAAVTAADTNQIATAMEKTASIAASANMEFETTAALLAQIIETTQEAPETAGTALKTIIARFSEVKNLKEQGLVSGEDSEGEIIDVNKIQTALRSVGISMDEYFAGTEGLHEVLLRLAEKWGTLDFETQRYIATMAAGSRQQSRFIAMMSDYGRTQELVTAANNSAGASQRQFEKTTDSLESSLTRLKNAWDEFTMGLANNEIIKVGVDLLTGLLETINNITAALSGDNGMVKSVLSLVAAFGALQAGKTLFNGLGSKFGGFIGTGTYKETTTESVDENGKPIKVVLREPYKEGKEAGTKTGKGFVDGFKSWWKDGWFREIAGTEQVVKDEYNREALGAQIDKDLEAIEQGRWTTKKKGRKKRRVKRDYTEDELKRKGELEGLKKELDGTSKSTEKLAKKYAKMGGEVSKNNGIIRQATIEQKKYTVTTDSIAKGIGKVGSVAVAAGAATLLLSQALSAMGEEEAAEVAEKIGSIVTGLGSLAMMAPQALNGIRSLAKTFGTTTAKMSAFLIIAALVVTAIVAIVNAFKKFGEARKLSTQIDAVNEKISKLGDAAEEAKNKINDIAESRKEFDDMKKSFDGLVKGTKEWREQLVKSNSEVLGLIEKYPQLSEYLTTGENGELTITDEGWDALAQQAQQQQAAAVTAQMSLQLQKSQLEEQQAFENALSDSDRKAIERERAVSDAGYKKSATGAVAATGGAIGAGVGLGVGLSAAAAGTAAGAAAGSVVPIVGTLIGAVVGALAGLVVGLIATEAADAAQTQEDAEREATGGLTQKEFSDFAVAAQRQGLYMSGESQANEEGFKKLYEDQFGEVSDEEWNTFWGNMEEMGGKFDQLAAQTEALRLAQETYTQSILTTAAQANPYLANSKFQEQAVEGVSSSYGEEMNQLTEELAEKYSSGEYVDKDGKPTEKLIEAYSGATGLKEDEIRAKIKDESLSAETMAQTVASKEATDVAGLKMQKLAQELTKVEATTSDKKGFKMLQNVLSDEGKALKKTDLDYFKEKTDLTGQELAGKSVKEQTEIVNGYLGTMGTSLEALGIDVSAFVDNLVYGEKELENAYKFFEEGGYDTDNMQEKIDAATGLAFSKKIDATGLTASEEELKGFVSDIDRIIGDLPEDQAEKFIGALNDVDWTQTESVEGLSENLEALSIDLSKAGINVEELEDRIKDMAKATSGLTFKQQAEQLTNLFALGEKLKGETGPIILNENEKKLLIDSGKFNGSDFEKDPLNEEQYIYKGGRTREEVDWELKEQAAEAYKEAIEDDKKSRTWQNNKSNTGVGYEGVESQSSIMARTAAMNFNNSLKAVNTVTKEDLKTYYGIDADKGNIDWNQDGVIDKWDKGWLDNHTAYDLLLGENVISDIPKAVLEKAVPDKQYEENPVSITAEDIATEKVQVVDELPSAEDMEKNGGKYITTESLRQMLLSFGKSETELEGLSSEDLKAILMEYYNSGKISSDGELEDLAHDAFYHIPLYELAAQALSSDEAVNGENQIMKDTMNTLAVSYGLVEEELELYEEKLRKAGYSTEEAKYYAIALAKQLQDLKNAYQNTSQAVGDYIEKLKKVPEGSDQYDVYIKQIGAALKNMYGVDPGDEWIKTNLGALEQWADGSEEAYEQVGKAMAQFYLNQIIASGKLTMNQLDNLDGLLNFMDDQEATAVFTLDNTPLLQGISFAEDAIEGLQQYFQNRGFAVQWGGDLDENGQRIIASLSRIETPILDLDGNASKEKWENPYDVFYNTLQKINQSLREREKLERQYQRLMDRGEATAEKLTENIQKQAAELQKEAELQNDVISGRKTQMNNYVNQSGLKKYAWIDDNGNVQIDWKKINKETDPEKGAEIEEYISKLEEWSDSLQEAEDRLEEIEDEVYELNETGKDEYLDFEQTVSDALKQSYQEQIDKLSEINESINDANAKMIESMQEAINKDRQARQNEKTEQDIVDKQQRLAYLQMDTSGANDMEILALQKEIDEAQEDYTDTLIDQKISDLQKQNEEAAEQRERQIQIAQQQLDQWFESGSQWQTVQKLIEDGTKKTEGLLHGSELETLLKNNANWQAMSDTAKSDWFKDANLNIAAALTWIKGIKASIDTSRGSGSNPDNKNAEDQTFVESTKTTGPGNPVEPGEPSGEGVDIARLQRVLATEGLYSGEASGEYNLETQAAVKAYQKRHGLSINANNSSLVLDNYLKNENIRRKQQKYRALTGGKDLPQYMFEYLEKINARLHSGADEQEKKKLGVKSGKIPGSPDEYASNYFVDPNGFVWVFNGGNPGSLRISRNAYQKFETGGLADYTGPAWLDGTKSRPELVLNAQDTQNFIQLKDILSSIMSKPLNTSQKTEATTFDIDINVESIKEEADLEMIANYIENKITTSANYRGNNFVSTSR